MPSIDVCFTPALLHLYEIESKVVVMIDIFRASSSICYGFENGALEIIPVSSVTACQSYAGKGYLLAAERDGKVVEGFDFGNSPYSYTAEKVGGKRIVLTTTNGTYAIEHAAAAAEIVIGSFLNITALCDWLTASGRDVLLLCAGWKKKFNLEDTIFGGAVIEQLQGRFDIGGDSGIAALDLYKLYARDLNQIIEKSSHSRRMKHLGIEQDARFCLNRDTCHQVPVLRNGSLLINQLPANLASGFNLAQDGDLPVDTVSLRPAVSTDDDAHLPADIVGPLTINLRSSTDPDPLALPS